MTKHHKRKSTQTTEPVQCDAATQTRKKMRNQKSQTEPAFLIDWNTTHAPVFDFKSEQPVQIMPAEMQGTRNANPPSTLNLTVDDLRRLWMNSIVTHVDIKTRTGCYIHKHKPSKPGGYVQIALHRKKHCAHVVSYMLWYRRYRPDWPVSHLCSKSTCCRPEHLVQEPTPTNESRKNCIHNSTYTACPHQPKCVGHRHLHK
jgi:hypothetical protein